MTGPYPPPGPPQPPPAPPPAPPPLQPPPYLPQQQPASGNRSVVIVVVSVVAVLAVACVAGIVGVAWLLTRDKQSSTEPPEVSGVIDYRAGHKDWLAQEHRPQDEQIAYPMKPAAGGPHHPVWQQCKGDVYTSPVDEGNAVHSLEHGAVWITYQQGLPGADVEKLAARVRGNDYMLMSPYDGQPTRISLQAWGYQLQLSSVDDPRIDAFIRKYRQTASMEPGVPCSTGSTATDGN